MLQDKAKGTLSNALYNVIVRWFRFYSTTSEGIIVLVNLANKERKLIDKIPILYIPELVQ